MMKKISIILLCLALPLAFYYCGGDDDDESGKTGDDDDNNDSVGTLDDDDVDFFDDDDDADKPGKCDRAIEPRTSVELACYEPEKCNMAEDNPGKQFRFLLKFKTEYEDEKGEKFDFNVDELKDNWECIADLIKGADEIVDYDRENPDEMDVLGGYENISDALDLNIIKSWEVKCRDYLCKYCPELSASECEGDIFCQQLEGNKYNHEQWCFYPYKTAACLNADAVCEGEGSIQYALAPDGDCWSFDGCVPEDWSTNPEDLEKYECTKEKTKIYTTCN